MNIRPYGDTANDGIVQLSFTLPLPLNARAHEAARRYAMLMGISNPLVAHAEASIRHLLSLSSMGPVCIQLIQNKF